MTVPSDAAFKEYIKALLDINARDIADQIFQEFAYVPAKKRHLNFRELVASGIQTMRTNTELAQGLEVDKWLADQKEFKMAVSRAFKIKNHEPESLDSRDLVDVVMEQIEKICADHSYEEMARHTPEGTRLFRYLHRIFDLPPRTEWVFQLARALQEYHYTNNASEISVCYKTVAADLEDARRSLTALQNAIQTKYSKHNGILDFGKLGMHVRRAVEALESGLPDGIESQYPIRRNDQTAPERLFVFRMYRAHYNLFRTPRPEAIVFLLDLEGIRHHLDLRNVEKLCAQYKANKREKRRLKTEYYKSIAG